MKLYKVKVTAYCPSPRKREYTVKGSNAGVVASRGVKKFRNEDEFKGKQIKKWQINIDRV